MASQVLKLFVDTARKTLVESNINKAVVRPPAFVQGDTVALVVQLLLPNPTGGTSAPYSVIPVSGLTLRVGIGTPTAATGSGAPGIFQNAFTLDSTLNTFNGTLVITPATVATELGAATEANRTFEIEVAEGGNYTTVYQEPVTLKAELIEGAATPPPPADAYMTQNETLATFVKRDGGAGEGFYLTSANGLHRAFVYLADDGTFQVAPVT